MTFRRNDPPILKDQLCPENCDYRHIIQPFHYYLDFGVQVGHANQSLPAVRERDEVREALRPGNYL